MNFEILGQVTPRQLRGCLGVFAETGERPVLLARVARYYLAAPCESGRILYFRAAPRSGRCCWTFTPAVLSARLRGRTRQALRDLLSDPECPRRHCAIKDRAVS